MASVKQRIIKKYNNRRLYDTERSCYITQEKIKEFVTAGVPFCIVSAKSGEDITRSVLLQIILDEEIMGVPLFSEEALRSIILFSGSGARSSFSSFLEQLLPFLQRHGVSDATALPGMPEPPPRFKEQMANMQGMVMGNMFQEYLNRSMQMFGEVNQALTQNTAEMIRPPAGKTARKKGRTKKTD